MTQDTDIDEPNRIPISQLDTSTQAHSGAVEGVVTLIWPYSISKQSFSILLAEPDFRLRRQRGQVRVHFTGSSAKAAARHNVQSGDNVILNLLGAQWEKDETAPSTPGRGVEWELHYAERAVLKVHRDGQPPIIIDVDHPVQSPEARSLSPLLDEPASIPHFPSTPIRFPAASTLRQVWSTPAFLKRDRRSTTSFFGSDYDPFDEDEFKDNNRRKKTKFGRNSDQWRFTEKSSSPENVAEFGVQVDDRSTVEDTQDSRVNGHGELRETMEPDQIDREKGVERISATEELLNNVRMPDDSPSPSHAPTIFPAEKDVIESLASSKGVAVVPAAKMQDSSSSRAEHVEPQTEQEEIPRRQDTSAQITEDLYEISEGLDTPTVNKALQVLHGEAVPLNSRDDGQNDRDLAEFLDQLQSDARELSLPPKAQDDQHIVDVSQESGHANPAQAAPEALLDIKDSADVVPPSDYINSDAVVPQIEDTQDADALTSPPQRLQKNSLDGSPNMESQSQLGAAEIRHTEADLSPLKHGDASRTTEEAPHVSVTNEAAHAIHQEDNVASDTGASQGQGLSDQNKLYDPQGYQLEEKSKPGTHVEPEREDQFEAKDVLQPSHGLPAVEIDAESTTQSNEASNEMPGSLDSTEKALPQYSSSSNELSSEEDEEDMPRRPRDSYPPDWASSSTDDNFDDREIILGMPHPSFQEAASSQEPTTVETTHISTAQTISIDDSDDNEDVIGQSQTDGAAMSAITNIRQESRLSDPLSPVKHKGSPTLPSPRILPNTIPDSQATAKASQPETPAASRMPQNDEVKSISSAESDQIQEDDVEVNSSQISPSSASPNFRISSEDVIPPNRSPLDISRSPAALEQHDAVELQDSHGPSDDDMESQNAPPPQSTSIEAHIDPRLKNKALTPNDTQQREKLSQESGISLRSVQDTHDLPTPQLTQNRSSDIMLPASLRSPSPAIDSLLPLIPFMKSSPRAIDKKTDLIDELQRLKTGVRGSPRSSPRSRRVSNIPASISPWFAPKRVSDFVPDSREQSDVDSEEVSVSPSEEEASMESADSEQNEEEDEEEIPSSSWEAPAESQVFKPGPQDIGVQFSTPLPAALSSPHLGLRTSHAYYSPLSTLASHFANQTSTLSIVLASIPPARAASGPRDFYTTILLTDPSSVASSSPPTSTSTSKATIPPSVTLARIFRPSHASLPSPCTTGSILLLRSFTVQSTDRRPSLLSSASSAWAIFHPQKPDPIISGPPLEFGAEERGYVRGLGDWWDQLSSSVKSTIVEQANRQAEKMKGKEERERIRGRRLKGMGLRLAPGALKEKEEREVVKGEGKHSLRDGKEWRDDVEKPKRGYKKRANETVKHQLRDGTDNHNRIPKVLALDPRQKTKPPLRMLPSLSILPRRSPRRHRRPSLRTQLREATTPGYCIIPYRECLVQFREDIWKVPKRDGDATPPVSPKTVPVGFVNGEEVEKLGHEEEEDGDNSDASGGEGDGSAGDEGLRLKQYGEGDGRVVEEMEMPGASCQREGNPTTFSRKKRRVMLEKDVGDRAARKACQERKDRYCSSELSA
ncbi:MAG: hypothetical protein LQ352_001844 [Teloschistes flavicans]|nr:MAG: hypothetical protein LQ352_001844 [Teloschistes flavicans]